MLFCWILDLCRKEEKRLNEKLSFSVTGIELLNESNDSQFATLKIDAFASGDNSHSLYVSEQALRNAAETILEKPIVWKYSPITDDAMSHEKEEYAVGFVPKDTTIDFRTLDDGRVMMSIIGKLWTKYSGKLMEIFQRDKSKSVSVEIEVLDKKNESDFGMPEILAFCYRCITVLGQIVRPAIQGAKADLIAFAIQEEASYQEAYSKEFSNKYADIDFTIPRKVKLNAQKSLDEHKKKGINGNSVHLAMARFLTKNEKATPEKIKSMAQFFDRKVQYDEITIGFYGGKAGCGWSKDIMSKIDDIDSKQLSYFSEDNNVITFPYSKIEDAPENMKKLDGVSLTLDQINQIAKVADEIGVNKEKNGYAIAKSQFKKSHKIKDGKWVKMADEEGNIELNSKKKEDNSVKVEKTELIKNAEIKFSLTSSQIVQILNSALSEFKYGENNWEKYWVYSFDNEYSYVRDSEDGKSYRMKYSIENLKAKVDVESKEEVIEGSPLPISEEKYIPEFSDEEDDNNPEDEKGVSEKDGNKINQENMSLDGNLDVSAYLGFLENATDVSEEMTAKYKASDGTLNHEMIHKMAYNKMCKMAEDLKKAQEDKDVYMAEIETLKKFKKDTESKQFACELESTFAEVSEVLPKEEVDKFREESINYSLDTISELQNKIKAVAFSYTGKSKKIDDGITRFANSWVNQKSEKDYTNGWIGKA